MKYAHFSRSRLLLFACALILFGAGQAHARRGFKLITTGTSISELGPVKPEFRDDVKAPNGPVLDKVGFKYDFFGLFWLDLWNWDGEYCIFHGDDYSPLSKHDAAQLMGVDESKLGKPINYRFPYGLDILIGLTLLKFLPRFIAKRKAARANAVPAWTPPPAQPPPASSAEGPPPVPPPLPPDQP